MVNSIKEMHITLIETLKVTYFGWVKRELIAAIEKVKVKN